MGALLQRFRPRTPRRKAPRKPEEEENPRDISPQESLLLERLLLLHQERVDDRVQEESRGTEEADTATRESTPASDPPLWLRLARARTEELLDADPKLAALVEEAARLAAPRLEARPNHLRVTLHSHRV